MLGNLLFIDLEATQDGKIFEIGLLCGNDGLKCESVKEAIDFIKNHKIDFVVGHNYVGFDKKIVEQSPLFSHLANKPIIDTLLVSMLLFNEKTFHSLPKNYKSEDAFENDPLQDAKLSKELLQKCIEKFKTIPSYQADILYSLLRDVDGFSAFFSLIGNLIKLNFLQNDDLVSFVNQYFREIVVNKEALNSAIVEQRVELAFILAIRMPYLEINVQPPKVLYDYPSITTLQESLCFDYKKAVLEIESFSKENFGFDKFRDFDREDASLMNFNKLSQKEIVEASLRGDSFLTVLPTGGGKTFTFWLPAIMRARHLKSLTVVISPLQALIKDHIENFNNKIANFTAVALSGYLTPLERESTIDKVVSGEADILYIAPESLRSNTLFRILKNRVIERFVIDEAHCLSTWGNDFRHDYFYICSFIEELLAAKPFQRSIPVSCFTATAKPKVIADIVGYFESSLKIEMKKYIAVSARKNLDYSGRSVGHEKLKYAYLLELVAKSSGATLIYMPSSTKKCDEIAQNLAKDTHKSARSFHSKLSSEDKMRILKGFIDDEIDIVVATTAFGMGVDKPNIKNVIHYEISESLENYAQEAGRGARDENIRASCPLIFSSSDIDKHFEKLKNTKITRDEINAIFNVIKNDKRNPLMLTVREIASMSGFDVDGDDDKYSTKVKTALLELENEGYLSRHRDQTRYYANAVAKNAFAILEEKIALGNFSDEDKNLLSRVLHASMGAGKKRKAEVDELVEILEYPHARISLALLKLKEMGILTDARDLTLFVSQKKILFYKTIIEIETELYKYLLTRHKDSVILNELNEYLLQCDALGGVIGNYIPYIKTLLRSWKKNKSVFLFYRIDRARDRWHCKIKDAQKLKEDILYKQKIATKLLDYFSIETTKQKQTDEVLVEFSLLELREFSGEDSVKIIDYVLLHLHELKVVQLGNGRFIYYSPMRIEKHENMLQKNKKYTKEEYKKRLEPYYAHKQESIHIVDEYANRLIQDAHKAGLFMKDYFSLSYEIFKGKYKELRQRFKHPMTKDRYQKIFSALSLEQKSIIDDKESQAIMILAGPGSGKTKVLVHKIASLILQEDIKPEQFLMLTYSRTAMLEFRSRLFELIGQLAHEVDIYTFHSYALKLSGRKVEKQKNALLKDIIAQTTCLIESNEITVPFKTVMVLDEYQDISADGFRLIKALANANENKKRIIAVGDDDQCILSGVNGADVKFIDFFTQEFGRNEEGDISFRKYELLINFRSKNNIVSYSNEFIKGVSKRYKQNELRANSTQKGELRIVLCKTTYLTQPAILEVKRLLEEGRKIAVLAYSNDEVAEIYALLLDNGIEASYLLDSNGYSLKDLVELVALNSYLKDEEIDEESLQEAYEKTKIRYKYSKNISLVGRIIKEFIDTHEIYSRSLWEGYLDEISIDQFVSNKKRVIVSTIHKSKGKEFDAVVLIAHNQELTDDARRLFYVGMTRAKECLSIITDNPMFTQYKKESATLIKDESDYPEPNLKIFMMGLQDLYLSFGGGQDIQGEDILAGSEANISSYQKDESDPYYIEQNGLMIAKFSKFMHSKVKEKESRGYEIVFIVIENVVVWNDEKTNRYKQQPLCRIVMQKSSS